MSRYDEIQEISDKAFTCKSEEEAFEIIERLKPYLGGNGSPWDGESKDQSHASHPDSR
jgi:hypothetical protein